jgi:hypothetical protein
MQEEAIASGRSRPREGMDTTDPGSGSTTPCTATRTTGRVTGGNTEVATVKEVTADGLRGAAPGGGTTTRGVEGGRRVRERVDSTTRQQRWGGCQQRSRTRSKVGYRHSFLKTKHKKLE